jgi:hypothetical protein
LSITAASGVAVDMVRRVTSGMRTTGSRLASDSIERAGTAATAGPTMRTRACRQVDGKERTKGKKETCKKGQWYSSCQFAPPHRLAISPCLCLHHLSLICFLLPRLSYEGARQLA